MQLPLFTLLSCASTILLIAESYRFEKPNKVFPAIQNDETQVKPDKITSGNLFGWLNLKHYVRFRLWSRANPVKAQELKVQNEESLRTSTFDSKRLTKIIIHGFSDSANEVYISDYLLRIKDAYLALGDVNVIVVDYTFFALPLTYLTSIHEVVAEKLTELIQFLVKSAGVKLSSFHLVGMSWGGQIAGLTGHALQGKLGRITGLDPAGPLFRFVDNEFRLDKSDAQFVDIIHVNGGTRILFGGHFGLFDPLGHVDVYPNGGQTQIGCPRGRTLLFETLICSHARVVGYFLESISSPLAFPMCQCEDFDTFVKNGCPCTPSEFSYMGEHISHKTRGIFQLITRPKSPYGHGPRMQVTLPNVTFVDGNKILQKRSHTVGSVTEESEETLLLAETASVTYKNTTRHKQFNNEFSSDKFPNDYVLQIALVVMDESKNSTEATQ